MKCACCGENMIRRNSYCNKNGEMMHCYICSTYIHTKSCSTNTIQERNIEPMVLKAIQNQICILTEAQQVIQQAKNQPELNISVQIYDKQIVEAESEERRYLDLKTRLYADMRDGIVSREEFLDMSERFTKKAEAARKRRDELVKARETAITSNCDTKWMENFRAANGISELNRNIVVTLIDRIIVHGNSEIEIVFRYGDEMNNYIAFAEECRREV